MARDQQQQRADLSAADLERLAERGLSRAEAERQLELLTDPPPAIRLVRPCVVGDGIERLDPEREEELASAGAAAAAAGGMTKFVPASGAASRMFHGLMRALAGAGKAPLDEFAANLDRFAFAGSLRAAMAAAGLDLDRCLAAGDRESAIRHLLEEPGLGYRRRPKGLLEFHRYPDGARTAFEEQLVEAVGYARDRDGVCRLHFTLSAGHQELFREHLGRLRGSLLERYATRFEVGFSVQSPATDTLAVDTENRPFRLGDGRLLLRPGGHGALLPNLERLGADVVLIKNIDNVQPERAHELVAHWKRVLTGRLVTLQARIFELLTELEEGAGEAALTAGLELAAADLGVPGARELESAAAAAQRAYLLDLLDRPLRVCGMVPNEGEPGGGPFWVAAESGPATRQIVEQSQIDGADPRQRQILAAGTHFNPVDLACGVRDRRGEPYPLERFVDPEAVFISRRSVDGRELRALERPGLWNGAMAGWNTLFVEVPAATFAPVKTVFDLLRPAHQPRPRGPE